MGTVGTRRRESSLTDPEVVLLGVMQHRAGVPELKKTTERSTEFAQSMKVVVVSSGTELFWKRSKFRSAQNEKWLREN